MKMNFTAYIERQKNIIRSRHEGETFLIEKGEEIRLDETQLALDKLSALQGLNKRERLCVRRV